MKKLKLFIIICLIMILIPISINFFVIIKNNKKIYKETDIKENYDIALVLGCSVLKNGSPSKMLRDRLNTAIYLYKNNIVKNILISGDHDDSYSEVLVMYDYLLENNVVDEDILIDYKGYSTGESLMNYKKDYNDKSVIIVTQKYHLHRALYIADTLELNSIGVHAKLVNYDGQIFREVREILARNKDFIIYNFINQ